MPIFVHMAFMIRTPTGEHQRASSAESNKSIVVQSTYLNHDLEENGENDCALRDCCDDESSFGIVDSERKGASFVRERPHNLSRRV